MWGNRQLIAAGAGVLIIVGQFLTWAKIGTTSYTGFITDNELAAAVVTVCGVVVIAAALLNDRLPLLVRAAAIGAALGAAATGLAFYDNVSSGFGDSIGLWLSVAAALVAAAALGSLTTWLDRDVEPNPLGRYLALASGLGLITGALVQWTPTTTNGIDAAGGRWYAGAVFLIGLYELVRAGIYDAGETNWVSRAGAVPAVITACIPSLFFAMAFVQPGLSLGAGPWIVVGVAAGVIGAEVGLDRLRVALASRPRESADPLGAEAAT